MSTIQVACHTITWGREFVKALDEIAALDFKGFETFGWVADEYGDREEELIQMLVQRGLRLVTLYGGGALIEPAAVEEEIEQNVRWAKFLQEMGSDLLVLGGGTKYPEGNADEDYERLADVLSEIGRRTRELGVRCCYHPHWGTMVENREQIDCLCALTDPDVVLMCFDTAQLAKGGCDVVDTFKTYRDRLTYVHLKDLAAGSPAEAPFVELGKGVVDLKGVVQLLRETDYDGWVTIELDSSPRPARESVADNKRYVEEELGLKV